METALKVRDVGFLQMVTEAPKEAASGLWRRLSRTKPASEENGDGVEWVGEPGQWKLMFKAWNQRQGWMKSTKLMEVPGGVLVQVTTKEPGCCAEALEKIPGARLADNGNGTSRMVDPSEPPHTLTSEECMAMAAGAFELRQNGRPKTAAVLERALSRIRPGMFAEQGE